MQPAALPERLRLRLPRAPAASTSTSVQCTLRTVQLDSWGGGLGLGLGLGAAAAPRVVLCAEESPQWGSAAAAAAAPRRAVARVSLIASRHGAAPAHLQLAEVRLMPLALTLDDLLVARISALLEASATCARSTHAALRAADDGAPSAATSGPGSAEGAAPSPQGLPRAARAPPRPLLYVERLSVSEVRVSLSAHTLTLTLTLSLTLTLTLTRCASA